MVKYRAIYNAEPKFMARYTSFGLGDDEVLVGALLVGTDLVPSWEFRTIFNGEHDYLVDIHMMDISSSAVDSFGLMKWDLAQAAGPRPA